MTINPEPKDTWGEDDEELTPEQREERDDLLASMLREIAEGGREEHAARAAALREEFREKVAAFTAAGVDAYLDFREDLLSASLKLNEQQRWAPRFRSLPKLPPRIGSGASHRYLIDLQVIDLHWRAHSEHKPHHRGLGLFQLPFPYEVADKFASRPLPFPAKVMDLALTASMEMEHAVLQRDSLRDKWRRITAGVVKRDKIAVYGVPQVAMVLQEVAEKNPRLRRFSEDWVNVWVAAQLVGDKQPQKIARMVALMTGDEPADRSATAKKLATVVGHLEKFKKSR